MQRNAKEEGIFPLIKTFCNRVLISVCYTCVNEIKLQFIRYLPVVEHASMLSVSFILMSTYIVVKKVKPGKGLQTILSIFFADTITESLMVIKEPSSYVLIPSILLYICVIAILMTLLYDATKSNDPHQEYVFRSVDDFIILYTASRSLKYFQNAQQLYILGILSLTFLSFPSLNTSNVFSQNVERIIESLAARGFIMHLTSSLKTFSGVSNDLHLITTEYTLLHIWNHFMLNTKLKICGDIIVLSCTQKLTVYLTSIVSATIATSVFVTLYSVLWYNGICPHLGCKFGRLGASFTFSALIETYVNNVKIHEEKIFWYITIITLLEKMIEFMEKKDREETSSKKNVETKQAVEIKDTASSESQTKKENDLRDSVTVTPRPISENVHVSIENANTLLGLPQT